MLGRKMFIYFAGLFSPCLVVMILQITTSTVGISLRVLKPCVELFLPLHHEQGRRMGLMSLFRKVQLSEYLPAPIKGIDKLRGMICLWLSFFATVCQLEAVLAWFG